MKVSVVIPTLGGDCLSKTIEQLNAGSIVPSEILICIPKENADRVSNLLFPNIKIIPTGCRGQVAQRAQGFIEATGDFVMQLDDDCLVEYETIEILVRRIRTSAQPVAISPLLFDNKASRSLYTREKSQFYEKILALILNGTQTIRPGSITRSGVNFGVDFSKTEGNSIEAEWLPGGCVMHLKDRLILESFYPYGGKAYCEDLMHSWLLKKSGLTLIITNETICRTEIAPARVSFKSRIKDAYNEYRARKYYLKMAERPSCRVHWFFIITVISKIIIRPR